MPKEKSQLGARGPGPVCPALPVVSGRLLDGVLLGIVLDGVVGVVGAQPVLPGNPAEQGRVSFPYRPSLPVARWGLGDKLFGRSGVGCHDEGTSLPVAQKISRPRLAEEPGRGGPSRRANLANVPAGTELANQASDPAAVPESGVGRNPTLPLGRENAGQPPLKRLARMLDTNAEREVSAGRTHAVAVRRQLSAWVRVRRAGELSAWIRARAGRQRDLRVGGRLSPGRTSPHR